MPTMARMIFPILALLALCRTSNGSPIGLASTCIMPTVTTGGNKLIGYAQATAQPGIANIFPFQAFSDHHMIGGNAYHPSVTDRSTVEWGCQYTCGQNCFAFFVFWDTTLGKVPHYECRVYAAPFGKSDLVSSPKKEWTKGQAFNKQCFGPAMKFKRVDSGPMELGTAGTEDAAAATTSGPYPTSALTKTLPATKTVTLTLKQVSSATVVSAAHWRPTWLAWPDLSTTTFYSTVASEFSHIPPSPTTASTKTQSTCSRGSFIADGATVTGFAPAPAPTVSATNYDVDPKFSTAHLISHLYLAAEKKLGHAVSKCANACTAHPQCVSFIVTEGRYSNSFAHSLNEAYQVLLAQVADLRAVTRPDGLHSWTCDLYKHALGADQMVKAPENERTIAAFNDMCPAVNA